jgi:hypothetical protein
LPPVIQAGRQNCIPLGKLNPLSSDHRTPIVRISPLAHAVLRQLADEEHASMQAVLDRAIERYRRERFLRAANAEYQALRGDPKAWEGEVRERALWEHTIADGLDRK